MLRTFEMHCIMNDEWSRHCFTLDHKPSVCGAQSSGPLANTGSISKPQAAEKKSLCTVFLTEDCPMWLVTSSVMEGVHSSKQTN